MNLKIKLNVFFTSVHFIIKAFNNVYKLDHDLWKESNSPNHNKDHENSLRFVHWEQISVPNCCQGR